MCYLCLFYILGVAIARATVMLHFLSATEARRAGEYKVNSAILPVLLLATRVLMLILYVGIVIKGFN